MVACEREEGGGERNLEHSLDVFVSHACQTRKDAEKISDFLSSCQVYGVYLHAHMRAQID